MKKTIAVFIAPLLVVLIFCACQSRLEPQDISAYGDAQITISGIRDVDFTITVNDLSALETVSRKASAKRANGETVSINAVGPLLSAFLAEYGYSQNDFSRIRFTGSDKYSIALNENILQNREIILAVADGNSPLSVDDLPVRVVVPGERAMYWVRMLSHISFEADKSGQAAPAAEKIVVLETAAAGLPAQEYEYNGAMDLTVSVADLFGNYAASAVASNIYLLAGDGLEKTESLDDMLQGVIKFTGADSPRFISEHLPVGMHTFNLVWINYGAIRFVSMKQLLAPDEQAGKIFFSDVLYHSEMVGATTYYITCSDQSSLMLDAEELANASFYLDEAGNTVLDPGDGSEPISNILSIEAVMR